MAIIFRYPYFIMLLLCSHYLTGDMWIWKMFETLSNVICQKSQKQIFSSQDFRGNEITVFENLRITYFSQNTIDMHISILTHDGLWIYLLKRVSFTLFLFKLFLAISIIGKLDSAGENSDKENHIGHCGPFTRKRKKTSKKDFLWR